MLSGIRTVLAFGGEKIEVERYKKHLQPAQKIVEKKGAYASIGDASMRLLYLSSFAMSLWFGVKWVLEDRDKVDRTYTISAFMTVFHSDSIKIPNAVNQNRIKIELI